MQIWHNQPKKGHSKFRSDPVFGTWWKIYSQKIACTYMYLYLYNIYIYMLLFCGSDIFFYSQWIKAYNSGSDILFYTECKKIFILLFSRCTLYSRSECTLLDLWCTVVWNCLQATAYVLLYVKNTEINFSCNLLLSVNTTKTKLFLSLSTSKQTVNQTKTCQYI
jgi:hypothetical protein